MPYPYGGLRIRPVISLGKVRSTVTIPTFDVLTNEPVGNCIKIENDDAFFDYLSGSYTLFADYLNQIFIDLWVKPISFTSGQTGMVIFRQCTSVAGNWTVAWDLAIDNAFNVTLRIYKDAVTVTTMLSNYKAQPGVWNHIGVVWDGTLGVGAGKNGYIWVNGKKTTIPLVTNTNGPWFSQIYTMYFMGRFPTGITGASGKFYFDEIRLWNAPQNDDYFKLYPNCPRSTSASSDVTLIDYFRCNTNSLVIPDAQGSGDNWSALAGTPVVITTEEYPSSLMSSYPRVHIPLSGIGRNFTFKLRPERPSSADFGLAVYFTDDEGNDKRYFLWRSDGLRSVDHIPDYSGERIVYGNSRLEVWYNYLDRRVSLAAPITLTLGQLLERSSYAAQGDTNVISPTADTTIAATFPLTFPITFNS